MDPLPEAELCFPELLNASCHRPQLPPNYQLMYILTWFISVLTVALNLLVIISISHYRQLHTTTNLLMLSLGATDLTAGLMMPVLFFNYTSCWYLGHTMCSLVLLLIFNTISTSVGNILLISVDRYVAICEPMHYHTKVTVTRVQMCVCLCWASCVLYNLLIFVDRRDPEVTNTCHGECAMPVNLVLGYFDLFLTFIVPVIVMVLYSRVFVVAVSQARAHRSNTVVSDNITVRRSQLKAARTLGVVVLVYLLCCGPFYCAPFTDIGTLSMIWSVYMNSSLNPLIYALFYPWFKKTIKLILTLQILQTDSSKASIL